MRKVAPTRFGPAGKSLGLGLRPARGHDVGGKSLGTPAGKYPAPRRQRDINRVTADWHIAVVRDARPTARVPL
jgi:hypothetical protein